MLPVMTFLTVHENFMLLVVRKFWETWFKPRSWWNTASPG